VSSQTERLKQPSPRFISLRGQYARTVRMTYHSCSHANGPSILGQDSLRATITVAVKERADCPPKNYGMNTVDQALLLAAGRGTRMGKLTEERPKPLLEIAGLPIMEHVLRGLADVGIARAVIVVGYLGDQIEHYFGDGSGVGMQLTYCLQESQTGTASAALLARPNLAPAPFMMSFGDILCARTNYRKLLAYFKAHPCDALLGLNPVDDPWEARQSIATATG